MESVEPSGQALRPSFKRGGTIDDRFQLNLGRGISPEAKYSIRRAFYDLGFEEVGVLRLALWHGFKRFRAYDVQAHPANRKGVLFLLSEKTHLSS